MPRLIKKVLELGGAPIFSGHVTLRALVWPVVKLVGSPLQQLRASSHDKALPELELINNGFKGNQDWVIAVMQLPQIVPGSFNYFVQHYISLVPS